MADLLYTFHCADVDRDPVCEALRAVVATPIHRRHEDVLGRDFGDAGTAEQVSGSLRRTAIQLVADESLQVALTDAVTTARRRSPVRWIAVPVVHAGRIA